MKNARKDFLSSQRQKLVVLPPVMIYRLWSGWTNSFVSIYHWESPVVSGNNHSCQTIELSNQRQFLTFEYAPCAINVYCCLMVLYSAGPANCHWTRYCYPDVNVAQLSWLYQFRVDFAGVRDSLWVIELRKVTLSVGNDGRKFIAYLKLAGSISNCFTWWQNFKYIFNRTARVSTIHRSNMINIVK